jgi:hypothetical protein
MTEPSSDLPSSAASAGSLQPADDSICPHIDLNDPRCSARFTLSGVEDAFGVCCGGHHGCATFHRINMEIRFRAAAGSDGSSRGGVPPRSPLAAVASLLRDRGTPSVTMPTADGRPLRIRPSA